jgi:transposase
MTIATLGGAAMKAVTIGIDIGKSSFHVHGVDDNGKTVVSRSLKRTQVKPFFSRQTSSLVGMESCSTSNYWAREIKALGHDVKLIPAAYVKPFVKRDKSDRKDAEAICEAVRRPNLLFVPIKSEEQQSVLALHRTRNLLANQSVMLRNSMRSWLAEFGIIAPMGKLQFVKMIAQTLRFAPLPKYANRAIMILVGVWKKVEADIKTIEKDLMAWHRKNATSKRLTTIPGVGYLTATAVVSVVGDFRRFKTAQQFASWLGLVPRQISSGGRIILGKISKKGDVYLRRLLYLCAFAVMTWARKRSDPLSAWAMQLSERKKKKLVCMAIANKLARIIWVISVRKEAYREATAVI